MLKTCTLFPETNSFALTPKWQQVATNFWNKRGIYGPLAVDDLNGPESRPQYILLLQELPKEGQMQT